ncbi:hypothetical protein D3C79_967770 [compost metagenome]
MDGQALAEQLLQPAVRIKQSNPGLPSSRAVEELANLIRIYSFAVILHFKQGAATHTCNPDQKRSSAGSAEKSVLYRILNQWLKGEGRHVQVDICLNLPYDS